jgi:hypothetical protein
MGEIISGFVTFKYGTWQLDCGPDFTKLWTHAVELKEHRILKVLGSVHDDLELLDGENA